MRRGSIFTYAEEGRRNSSHMAQLEITNNRTEYSVDNIKYNREGGCFVSNKKFAICFLLFIVCVSGAGFVGHRFAFSPKTKVHDPLDLLALEESEEKNNSVNKLSLSRYIHPSRYRIILTPIFLTNVTAKMKGHIIIEFQQENSKSVDKLILNAQNIKPLKYRLMKGTHSRNGKKRELEEVNDDEITTLREEVSTSSSDGDSTTLGYTHNNGDEDATNSVILDSTTANDDNASKLHDTEKPIVEKFSSKDGERGNHSGIEKDFNGDPNHETLKDVGIGSYEINEANKVHVIHPVAPIEPGNYSLEIEYEFPINNSGILVTNFTAAGETRLLMATQLKPTDVRRLFPVFDDMKFKARFSLSMSHPKEMRVLSNMPLEMSNDSSDGQVTDTFEETPKLSPNNFAFIYGNIQKIVKTDYGDGENSSVITFWGDAEKRSETTYLSDKIDVVLDKFVNLFSITYPMKKMDLIGIPMTLDGTGSPGLISIKEQLFYLQEESPVVLKMHAMKNLIHQVGRQWLGGVINTQNWTDTWLLEGSLIYFSHAFLKEIDPAFDTSGSFESDVQWNMMDRDAYSVSRSLQSKVHASHLDNFDVDHHYMKGACLIRMLHGLLNDTAFRSGYQKFASRWIYDNGNLNSFLEGMSEETKNQTENLNLIDVMNPWIYQNGYPVVSVKRNYEIGSVTINQVWFTFDNISEKSEKLWYIPLSFTNSSDNWSSPSKILMTKKEMSVENVGIANESWIVFNIDGEGYYRVNYDNDNWKFLAEALKENPEQFPPATRASLIDDVLSLAQGGLTSYRVALDFINYMRTKERHYAPWAALTTHLLKLKFALYDTDMYSDFQKFARQFLSAIYNETESTNEGSQLAVVIKKFACTFEHPQCVDWAKKIFAEAKTSGVNSVSLHTREIFYCTVARVGGEDDWQYLLQKAINATDKEEKNRLLSSLACFQVPWILQKILKMTLEENLFSEEENRLILHSFSRNPEAAFAVQRFIERNWPEITKRYQSSYFMMKEYILAMTKSLMTKQDLVMFQEFRDNNIKSLKAVGFNVVLAEVESSSWEQWRNISLPVIETWIKESNKV